MAINSRPSANLQTRFRQVAFSGCRLACEQHQRTAVVLRRDCWRTAATSGIAGVMQINHGTREV